MNSINVLSLPSSGNLNKQSEFKTHVLKVSAIGNALILTLLILSACEWLPVYPTESEATFLLIYNTIWSTIYSISLFLFSKAWTLYTISSGSTFDALLVFISRYPKPTSFKGRLTSTVILLIPTFGMVPSLMFKSCLTSSIKYQSYTEKIDLVDYIGEVQHADNSSDPYLAGALIQSDIVENITFWSTVIQYDYTINFSPDYDTSYSWSSTPRPDGVSTTDSEVFVALYHPFDFLYDYASIDRIVHVAVPAAFVLVKCELVEQKLDSNGAQNIDTASSCKTSKYWQTFNKGLGVGSCNSGLIYDIVVVSSNENKYMHCAGEPYNGTAEVTFERQNGNATITIKDANIQNPSKSALGGLYSVSTQGLVAATNPVRRVEHLSNMVGSPDLFYSIKRVVVATILASDLRQGYAPDKSLLNGQSASVTEAKSIVLLNTVGGIVLICINIATLSITLLLLLYSTEISEVNARTFLKWVKQYEQSRAADIENLVDSDTVLVVSEVEDGRFALKPVTA
ncbi:hypothetical protein HDV06_006609 [Boothiomyces sp. JEL0866]|nr:hypothetical protein HDV06_006609 [Boothiomyces sp. JEL0866]